MSKLMTVVQAAARLGYDASHVRRLLKRGVLHGTRLGWIWLVETREVERYGQDHPRAPQGRPRKTT